MGEGPELWDVRVRRSAAKELRNLPSPEQGDVLDILEDLKEDPFPAGADRLRSYRNRYKIRFGRGERYRLFYEVFPAKRGVSVTRIELRSKLIDILDRLPLDLQVSHAIRSHRLLS